MDPFKLIFLYSFLRNVPIGSIPFDLVFLEMSLLRASPFGQVFLGTSLLEASPFSLTFLGMPPLGIPFSLIFLRTSTLYIVLFSYCLFILITPTTSIGLRSSPCSKWDQLSYYLQDLSRIQFFFPISGFLIINLAIAARSLLDFLHWMPFDFAPQSN